jgi:hypothetical protein
MNTQSYYPITKEQLQLKEDTTELKKMILVIKYNKYDSNY